MEFLVNAAYYVLPFIILLGVLVFVHELGHYAVAKFCGVKVVEFSIGFGKKLFGFFDKSGTEWKVCLIPLGGYVKMLGDDDASSSTANADGLSDIEKKQAFSFQSPYKKLLISLAGPAANYIFAITIFAGVFFFLGKISFPAVVGSVIEGGAAQKAGILANDKILSVNGSKVENFEDVKREVDLTTGLVKLEILRNESVVNLEFPLEMMAVDADLNNTTEIDAKEKDSVKKSDEPKAKPMLGIRSSTAISYEYIDMSFFQAISESVKETVKITDLTLRGVGQMITGQRNADEVGGILRIAEMSGDISKESGFVDFLIFMALLSINLGLINLFPIPVLDGGHVVFYTLEIITRRELNEKFKEWLFRLGIFLIILLMVFATYNDVARLFNRWFS